MSKDRIAAASNGCLRGFDLRRSLRIFAFLALSRRPETAWCRASAMMVVTAAFTCLRFFVLHDEPNGGSTWPSNP
jgi:hypothetical protein